MTTEPRLSPTPRAAWVGVVIVAVTAVVYARVWTGDFEFVDIGDPAYVTANPNVSGGPTAAALRWALTSRAGSTWHPLTWVSLQIDAGLYGMNPRGFHFTNALLHALNTLLVFAVLYRLTGAVWCSAVVAGLFGMHPVHVESVAWVARRQDVLGTFFVIVTTALYGWYARRPSFTRYLLVAAGLTLALMTSPALAAPVPLLFLLLDYWPLRWWEGPQPGTLAWARLLQLAVEKIPLLVLTVIPLWLHIQARDTSAYVTPPLLTRIGNAAVAYVTYLGMTAWPADLAVRYPSVIAPPASQALAASALLVTITAAAVALRRRAPYFIVGWLWFLLALVPAVGLGNAGGPAVADCLTYLSLIGLFVAVVWAVAALTARWRARAQPLAVTAGLMLAACGAWSWWQLGHWRTAELLWRHAVAVTRNNAIAHERLGMVFASKGDTEAAREQLAAAAELAPDSATVHIALGQVLEQQVQLNEAIDQYTEAIRLDPNLVPAHVGLGRLMAEKRRPEDALRHFQTALTLAPESTDARLGLGGVLESYGDLDGAAVQYDAVRRARPDWPTVYVLIGGVLRRQGKTNAALEQNELALAIDPQFADAHNCKGVILEAGGRPAEALASYRRAVEIEPTNLLFRCNLAFALFETGRTNEATAQYRESFRIRPRWPDLVLQEAWIKATHPDATARNGAEAVRNAKMVCQATEFQSAQALDVLAAAYAEQGQFADAVACERKAIERAPSDTPATILEELLDRLKLYEKRQPFRRPPPPV